VINSRRSDAPRPGAPGPDYGALDIKRDTGTSRRLEEVPPQWSNDGGILQAYGDIWEVWTDAGVKMIRRLTSTYSYLLLTSRSRCLCA